MSLLNSQTIFSILITLLIGVGLYYYIKYKYRVLELTQREQAKVLQSVIMAMNNNNENMMNVVKNKSQEEIVSDAVTHDMNRFRQVNSNNELIDVSDDSESDSGSDSDSDSGSDSSSESDSGSESGNETEHVEEQEVSDNTTKKILFTGNNESHVVEHLDGPDVKVIELTHPLYPKNSGEEYNGEDDGEEDEDDDVEDEEDSDSESLSSDLDGQYVTSGGHETHENNEICEIKGNVDINEVSGQIVDLETDNISEVTSMDNSLDNISVKTVFKTKDSETHSDYSSMNVQSLRQLLKNKLSSEGAHMSEASINKLTKKDLIKHLS
jgi:hypothetical protein